MPTVRHRRQCATPGCTRFIGQRDRHDTCPACRGADPRAPRPPRPGTTQARVFVHSTVSLDLTYASVTLQAPPWDTRP